MESTLLKMASVVFNTRENLKKIVEAAASTLGVDAQYLKDQQVEAVLSILKGKDTFVNLPTGFGKSLIYQVLPICGDRTTQATTNVNDYVAGTSSATQQVGLGLQVQGFVTVVSPLTSLITEQISLLKNHGIPAINLAELSPEEKRQVGEGFHGVVFASPETLLGSGSDFMASQTVNENLIGICVDESHCVVKWGQHSKEFAAFRESYGRIAELRSLVPRQVPMIALTATASVQARAKIMQSLGMCSPAMILESPEKKNIRYSHIHTSLTDDNPAILKCLADELHLLGSETPRAIIFCRTHRQVRSFYSYFRSMLSTETMKFVAMFHSTTDEIRKAAVSSAFQKDDGEIRILFCTIAFGMGVNVKGVTRVIHYGPPEGVDDYVQESGRAGRGGEQSYAILLSYSGCTRHKISDEMKEYMQENKTCRRKLLLHPFGYDVLGTEIPHLCCDVCSSKCNCGDGCCNDERLGACPFEVNIKTLEANRGVVKKHVVREVTEDQLNCLKEKLLEYRSKLVGVDEVETTEMLCGKDVASGFPMIAVEWIVRDAKYIDTSSFFHEKYPLFNSKYSEDAWEILCFTAGPPQEHGNILEEEPGDCEKTDNDSDSSCEITDHRRYRPVVVYSSSDSE